MRHRTLAGYLLTSDRGASGVRLRLRSVSSDLTPVTRSRLPMRELTGQFLTGVLRCS